MTNGRGERRTPMKLSLGLIAIAFLVYGTTSIILENIVMRLSPWVVIILGALVGGTAAGIAAWQVNKEIAANNTTSTQRPQKQPEAEKGVAGYSTPTMRDENLEIKNGPTFREKIDTIYFSLGEHGAIKGYKREQLKKGKVSPFIFDDYKVVTLYIENNRLYADVHNEFTIRNPNWDKNFNQNALEIVDGHCKPTFQMLYKTPTHIVIKGIFPYPGGVVFASDTLEICRSSALNKHPEIFGNFSLKRIFKYPYSKYPGQLDDGEFKPKE